MSEHPIIQILDRWPSRRAIADDMNRALVVVHRWFSRLSVPAEYDAPLIRAAKKRGINLTAMELASARDNAADQVGHSGKCLDGTTSEDIQAEAAE